MTRKQLKNIADSIRQRLFNRSRERGEDFQYVLMRYALERLLYRLSISDYREQFILKGASLFIVWGGSHYRPTKDADFLSTKINDPTHLRSIFTDICMIKREDDGLLFDIESIDANEIREDQQYGGVRVTMTAYLDSAKIPVQVDVGFGDAITPRALSAEYPTLLVLPAPKLRIYPRETVIAEKLEAMVSLGLANSRMRDFYDLWMMTRIFSFDGKILQEAIRRTFARRKTDLPKVIPVALTVQFIDDIVKQTQWKAFLNKSGIVIEDRKSDLSDIVDDLRHFLLPMLETISKDEAFVMMWKPVGPWE